jgi:hypothetical protein
MCGTYEAASAGCNIVTRQTVAFQLLCESSWTCKRQGLYYVWGDNWSNMKDQLYNVNISYSQVEVYGICYKLLSNVNIGTSYHSKLKDCSLYII